MFTTRIYNRPENFELPHSPKITFKQVKDLIGAYIQIPNAWTEIVNFFKEYHDIYQYIYAHLFPKTYVNRAGFRKKIQHKMCFERWQQKKKRSQELGKNPLNFTVEEIEHHPFEQVPITEEINFKNDDGNRADKPDTRKKLPLSKNAENAPPYPSPEPKQRFVYPPTMVSVAQFDQKFKLPKQKKVSDKAIKNAEQRQKTKERLEQQLAENDEKMKIINKNKTKTK